MHTHTHMYIYMHPHTHMYIYMHPHTHMYIYMHPHTHMYIHMCMHTHSDHHEISKWYFHFPFPRNFLGTCPYFLSPLFVLY